MSTNSATVLPGRLPLPDAVGDYFHAWNERDVEGVLAALAPGGTYENPTTGGPLAGAALAQHLHGFFAAFADVCFEVTAVCRGDDRLTIGWWMQGINTGPLRPGLPPTGAAITLSGIDLIKLETGVITSVRGFFDQQTLLQQLGLQVIVQPQALGPVTFGRALRLSTGSRVKPGAFSTTWIEVRDERHEEEVVERSRQMFAALLQMPGFIGATFTTVGRRLSTQTAWDSPESAHGMMKLMQHKEAVRRVFGGDLGEAGHTSVWAPERQNALWVRCTRCGQMEYYETGGRSACGEPFPVPPPYW